MLEFDVEQWGLTAAAVPAGMMVLGLFLWLLGRPLARPTCVISGLILGGMGGWLLGQGWANEGALALPLVIGGGIAGALLSALVFRLWMGLSGALILGLLGPAILFAGQAIPIHPSTDTAKKGEPAQVAASTDDADPSPLVDEMMRHLGTLIETSEQASPASATDGPAAQGSDMIKTHLRDMAGEMYDAQKSQFQTWWSELHLGWWLVVLGLGLVGAGVGLIVGLGWPYAMASVESALIGACLMLLGAQGWFGQDNSTTYLPQSPLVWGITLGLITVGGIVIQWILFARKTDK